MQKSSSLQSFEQPPPRPSTNHSDSLLDSSCSSTSQVDAIRKALTAAKVLGHVRRGRLATSEPPVARQALERTLQKHLERRLSQVSFTDSPEGSTCSFNEFEPRLNETPIELSPRTSSPLISPEKHPLAPGTPQSPAESLDSVFFPNSTDLPDPIQPLSCEFRPAAIMAELAAMEKDLKGTLRKISAIMEANPSSILTELSENARRISLHDGTNFPESAL